MDASDLTINSNHTYSGKSEHPLYINMRRFMDVELTSMNS